MLKRIIDLFYDLWDYGIGKLFPKGTSEHTEPSAQVLQHNEKHITYNDKYIPYGEKYEPKKSFIKRHPYVMCNLICIILASSPLWSGVSAFCGFWFAILALASIVGTYGIIFAAIIITNILGFVKVKSSSKAGVAFAVAVGSPGAFLAVHTVNKQYEYKKEVNFIFIVTIWTAVWALLGYHNFHISV